MREIKFRAWDAEKSKMVDVKAIDWSTQGGILSINYPHGKLYDAPEDFGGAIKLMQYTGLKDKNGVEIYEGDIVKSFGDVEVVEWKEDSSHEVGFRSGYNLSSESSDMYEVIGNIYENPELLKGD